MHAALGMLSFLAGPKFPSSLTRSRHIQQDIVAIPLFVEEMTKAALEAQGEGEAGRVVAAAPSPALAVPASLHASLMALRAAEPGR